MGKRGKGWSTPNMDSRSLFSTYWCNSPKSTRGEVIILSREWLSPRIVTGGPSSLHKRGRDSCLRVVLCYKRLFIKACMGCKQFFLKQRKNVMFFNKIDLPNCLVVFFVVCPRLRPFWNVFGELALFWCSTAKQNRIQQGNKVSRFY